MFGKYAPGQVSQKPSGFHEPKNNLALVAKDLEGTPFPHKKYKAVGYRHGTCFLKGSPCHSKLVPPGLVGIRANEGQESPLQEPVAKLPQLTSGSCQMYTMGNTSPNQLSPQTQSNSGSELLAWPPPLSFCRFSMGAHETKPLAQGSGSPLYRKHPLPSIPPG